MAVAVEGLTGTQQLLRSTDSEAAYGSLANFVIEKKIGRGQFSTVFRARCVLDGTTVALKKVQARRFFPSFFVLFRRVSRSLRID